MVGLCRLCASLRKIEVLLTIDDDSSEICEKLRKCCALNIKTSDALPKSICQNCMEKLDNSHKFYITVKEAQETLNSLYSPPGKQDDSEKNESVQPTAVQTASGLKKNLKQNLPLKKAQHDKFNENKEIPLEGVKKYQIETGTFEADAFQKMYNSAESTNEDTICESSYEVLESVKEDIVQTFNDIQQNNDVQILDDVDLESDEVIKHLNNIESENELHVEVEYIECYEDDESEMTTIKDIEQYVNDSGQIKHFSSASIYLEQISWRNYKYLCFICDNKFLSFVELKSHYEQEHDITHMDKIRYKCYDCKKIISRYNFFLNHVRSKHHNNLKLKCDVCDLSFQNFEELSHHRNANCTEAKEYAQILPCSQCFKSFDNVIGLLNHRKVQHDTSRYKVKYKCSQCNKEFQYKSCLKTHELLHTDKRKFSCIYCEKSFYNKLNLKQHLYVHDDEKLYQCNVCYKSYKTSEILNEHQKLHTNKKPFKCQFCEKCFNQKVQKIVHERSHTGEMPYQCNQCYKRFRYRSALHAHNKIHTGDKPYSCEYCVKTFADSSNRNKHVKRMHLITGTKYKKVIE